MNKDANNGEIHPLSYPPVKLQSSPTIIVAIRIGTIVILKLKNKRTNHCESPFCSGNLVKFCTILEFERIATNTYDTANEINDIATINEAIYGQDTGIFEKLPPEINRNDDAAVQAWWDSLPDGAVIDNSYRIIDMDDPYVIKGFKVLNKDAEIDYP